MTKEQIQNQNHFFEIQLIPASHDLLLRALYAAYGIGSGLMADERNIHNRP